MHEVHGRRRQGTVRKQPDLDDWLGDISEVDWSENAAELAERQRAALVRPDRSATTERDGFAESPVRAFPVAATGARRAAAQRRRAVAALVLLVIGLAAAAPVLLLRDGAEAPVTSAPESAIVATPTPTATDPVQTTPSTTPNPTTSATPSESVPTFALPEGTKLQRGESDGESDLTVSTDPELVAELQRALARAGFDPGSPDGTFGQNTEQAVVAFQQANGLPVDGIVGPMTAHALTRAVERG